MNDTEKAEAAIALLIEAIISEITKGEQTFGIIVRELFKSPEQREHLSLTTHKLIDSTIDNFVKLQTNRVAIVLCTLTCAKTMLEMIKDDILNKSYADAGTGQVKQ
jgi:uncharacterized membrane-anchored protein